MERKHKASSELLRERGHPPPAPDSPQASEGSGIYPLKDVGIRSIMPAGCFKHHTELRDFLGSKDAGFYLGLFSGEFPHEAFMYLVVVNPDYHRMGAGTRMYQDSLDKCTSAKRYAVSAIMKNKDLEAQAFHGALGFEVKELEFDWVPRDTSIIVKRKQLPVPVHVDWKWAQ